MALPREVSRRTLAARPWYLALASLHGRGQTSLGKRRSSKISKTKTHMSVGEQKSSKEMRQPPCRLSKTGWHRKQWSITTTWIRGANFKSRRQIGKHFALYSLLFIRKWSIASTVKLPKRDSSTSLTGKMWTPRHSSSRTRKVSRGTSSSWSKQSSSRRKVEVSSSSASQWPSLC